MFAMERCCSTHQIQLLKDNRSVHGSGAEHVRPAHLLADSGETNQSGLELYSVAPARRKPLPCGCGAACALRFLS
jgi:hypothetical protein